MGSTEPIPSLDNEAPRCIGAFKLIGDSWNLAIIDALAVGDLRFGEIEKTAKINPATLTTRLKQLEAAGLIVRKEHVSDKQSVNYLLTPLGRKVLPIIDEIRSFSEAFLNRESR